MSTTFGDKLKAIRKDKRWSLDKMAEFLGTNKQTLSRYERGERTPKISDVDAFAAKLGIPLEEFSERKGTMRIASTDARPFHPDVIAMLEADIREKETKRQIRDRERQDELKLIKIFDSLTSEGKQYLMQQAEIAKKMFEKG